MRGLRGLGRVVGRGTKGSFGYGDIDGLMIILIEMWRI